MRLVEKSRRVGVRLVLDLQDFAGGYLRGLMFLHAFLADDGGRMEVHHRTDHQSEQDLTQQFLTRGEALLVLLEDFDVVVHSA